MTSLAPNPIEIRLKKIERMWQQFTALPDARVCRWLVEEEEVKMVTGFVEIAMSEDSSHKDLFFDFDAPFYSINDYSKDLIASLYEMCQADAEVLKAEDLEIVWQPKSIAPTERNKAKYFLINFDDFSKQLSLLPNSLTVAFLAPDGGADQNFEKWLFEAVEAGIPPNLRIMLLDLKGVNWYEKLAKHHSNIVKTYEPDLDMYAAMKQLSAASATNADDPGVKFSQAFLELSQAASKNNLERMEQLQHLPLTIARQNNWKHLEVAVYMLCGSSFFAVKKIKECLPYYDQAIATAKTATEQGNPAGQQLWAQALICKGSAFVLEKDFKQAQAAYSEATEVANQPESVFIQIEAYRMEGYCATQNGDKQRAYDAYTLGLDLGERSIDPKNREQSTLPLIAKSLLDLTYQMGKKVEYYNLSERCDGLFGKNWQKKM
jgi:tetratricopeptide (TPR) repeat protein